MAGKRTEGVATPQPLTPKDARRFWVSVYIGGLKWGFLFIAASSIALVISAPFVKEPNDPDFGLYFGAYYIVLVAFVIAGSAVTYRRAREKAVLEKARNETGAA